MFGIRTLELKCSVHYANLICFDLIPRVASVIKELEVVLNQDFFSCEILLCSDFTATHSADSLDC